MSRLVRPEPGILGLPPDVIGQILEHMMDKER
jgi:hypothetical protein